MLQPAHTGGRLASGLGSCGLLAARACTTVDGPLSMQYGPAFTAHCSGARGVCLRRCHATLSQTARPFLPALTVLSVQQRDTEVLLRHALAALWRNAHPVLSQVAAGRLGEHDDVAHVKPVACASAVTPSTNPSSPAAASWLGTGCMQAVCTCARLCCRWPQRGGPSAAGAGAWGRMGAHGSSTWKRARH